MATTTPAAKNSVHWAPSPNLSPPSDTLSQSFSSSSSFTSSSSTIQYINSQLISHGFSVPPGLSLDGLSTADAENVAKCLFSMLSQRVEDMTRAEELTTKLRTLSYDHERLRTMHGAATETAESAEREAAAARAKLTIANRAQTQAEAAHKQTTGDLQRARTALQALRAAHVAEIKKREKEIEAMRERWSKLADAQLRISSVPSGMVFLGSPANASVLVEGGSGGGSTKKGVVEGALEEAEKARAVLSEENLELKGLVVDAANAVRKILHKAVSPDPDNLEFPPPLATTDLFPLGARDAAFERLSTLLTSLRDSLSTLRASDASPNTAGASESEPKRSQISLVDLAKKAAESDAKAHKWEVEELRNTIAGLRDELKKVKAEKKLTHSHTNRLQDIPATREMLASHLPPTDDAMRAGPPSEFQHEMEVINPEANTKHGEEPHEQHTSKKRELLLTAQPERRALSPTTLTTAGPAEPGPSRVSPRKTRSKVKVKVKTKAVHKSPLKAARTSRASPASMKKRSGVVRPRRLTTNKRVEASFETEVIPSTVPTSLLPTSFVLPPPSPESRLPRAPQPPPSSTHPTSFLTSLPSSVPPFLFPSTSTTPPFPPPVQQSTPWPPPISTTATLTETQRITVPCVPPIPAAAGTNDSELHHSPPSPLTSSRPFPLAKPMARNMSHAYSPVKPSPLSRILMLAASPENTAMAAAAVADAESQIASTAALMLGSDTRDPHLPPGTNAFLSGITSAPVFERPHPPLPPPPPPASMAPAPATIIQAAPAPLRTDTTSNTAGPQRRRSSTRKRTSLEAELDLDADGDANGDARPTCKNKSDAKDPRAPEKENTIRRRLRQGPAAGRNANANVAVNANTNAKAGRGGGVKTRKMVAAAAAASTTTSKAESVRPVPAATTTSDHRDHEPAAEAGRMGGAASRLLAAARGNTSAGGGPRRVLIDGTEAAAGVQARRVS